MTINQKFTVDNKLIEALQKFDLFRAKKLETSELDVFPSDDKGAAMIAEIFMPIAKYAIYGGHFHVEYTKGNNRFDYDIKFNKIELYYHDEIAYGHIDPIMYHSNLHIPYYFKDRGIQEYPYYELGALNLHTSGIDVSFENEKKKYRASFLIRDFTVYNAEDSNVITIVKADPYSTHAFDWFFPNGINEETMKQITWIEDIPYEQTEKLCIGQNVRQNVPLYDNNIKKIPETQCQKKWQFIRVE